MMSTSHGYNHATSTVHIHVVRKRGFESHGHTLHNIMM